MAKFVKCNKLLSTVVTGVLIIVGANFGVPPEVAAAIFSIAG